MCFDVNFYGFTAFWPMVHGGRTVGGRAEAQSPPLQWFEQSNSKLQAFNGGSKFVLRTVKLDYSKLQWWFEQSNLKLQWWCGDDRRLGEARTDGRRASGRRVFFSLPFFLPFLSPFLSPFSLSFFHDFFSSFFFFKLGGTAVPPCSFLGPPMVTRDYWALLAKTGQKLENETEANRDSFLSLGAACSTMSVAHIMITAQGMCPGKICIRYSLSAAMALLCWFMSFTSSILNFWILPKL